MDKHIQAIIVRFHMRELLYASKMMQKSMKVTKESKRLKKTLPALMVNVATLSLVFRQ